MLFLQSLYYIILSLFFFFFNDTATTEIYTLSLHDALPISAGRPSDRRVAGRGHGDGARGRPAGGRAAGRVRERGSGRDEGPPELGADPRGRRQIEGRDEANPHGRLR